MRQQVGKRRNETLVYLQAMLGELRIMAQSENCDMLAYLIEMAYGEASDIIRGDLAPAGRGDPVRTGPD